MKEVMDCVEEKMRRCREYVEALEVERQKIQVFQRELPLCLELVTQAIDACKQQISGGEVKSTELCYGRQQQQSESSEQTYSHGNNDVPVLEEFIPIRRSSSSSSDFDDGFDEREDSGKVGNEIGNNEKSGKKSDWLRSVQLWNPAPEESPRTASTPRAASVTEVKKKNNGAFRPFNNSKEKVVTDHLSKGPVSKPASSSTTETITAENGGSRRDDKEGQSERKRRRNWSPELHRRFLHALQQLGGPHVATPKQIRELMKVDGLTNDEVKSHLQKYRLHTRRPSPSIHNNGNPQAPQFVVVGGIWVPPPDYTSPSRGEANADVATNNGVYAPIATAPAPSLPPSVAHKQQEQHSKHSDGIGHSESPASSSSTRTTTTTPMF